MCGIVGIYGSPHAAKEGYLGLMMLQHRGQDSAGIVSFDEKTFSFHTEKNLGHVKEAIKEDSLNRLPGNNAIAHTRYSTIGHIRKEEIQPMVMNYPYGISMAHNGNIINSKTMKTELRKNRRLVLSQNDLEIMMNLFAQGISGKEQFSTEVIDKSISQIYELIEGAYSTVAYIADQGMLAFKDPHGIRPLVWGKRQLTDEEKEINNDGKEYSYGVASESKSLEFLGYEDVQELKQGELLFIAKDGSIYRKVLSSLVPRPCMFEWIYFANADSSIWNKNVYQLRLKLGQSIGQMLQENTEKFDVVVPVPDTSRPSAITISEELSLPYREVLIKNRYAQRTFILNTQKDREKAVNLKMNVVREEVEGKNVLLVDDSIVRGTTSKRIINLLKKNGAKKVYIVSTCPEIVKPCFYGIDFPSETELVANSKSKEEIAKTIHADGVFYPDLETFKNVFLELNPCMACLDGNYPVKVHASQDMITSRIQNETTSLPGLS